jgi:hypothetical protein
MSKMGSHDPFGHFEHKLWLKERPWIKLTIWFPTTKIQESPQFPCVQVACNIFMESSQRGLQFCFRPHLNRRSTHKVMGPQNDSILNFGNFETPTLESRDKNDIWVLVPWPGTKYIIRGKVVASPKFGSWWVLWIHGCMWFIREPKCSNYTLTNLLLRLCKSVWVGELLVNLSSPIQNSNTHLYPLRCCEPKNTP